MSGINKKIGLVSLVNWECNYGNRLQNYALQEVLKKLGCSVETINDCRYVNSEVSNKLLIKDLLHIITHFRYNPQIHRKRFHFNIWVRRHRTLCKYIIKKDTDFVKIEGHYDLFVTGSDQIWRPIFPATSNSCEFLQFTSPKKRIAYAPSFGLSWDNFPEWKKDDYRKWLSSDWKALSVREEEGARIIFNLSGKLVPVTLDPTLLLSRDEWVEIINNSKKPRNYIFVCVLRTNDYTDYIYNLAKSRGLTVIDVFNDKKYAKCDPSGFIRYISDAEFIFTNSYHCCVFSLLFHKRIIYYNSFDSQTQSISSRIYTLLKLAGIDFELKSGINEFPAFNWENFETNLHRQRKESLLYLKTAIYG